MFLVGPLFVFYANSSGGEGHVIALQRGDLARCVERPPAQPRSTTKLRVNAEVSLVYKTSTAKMLALAVRVFSAAPMSSSLFLNSGLMWTIVMEVGSIAFLRERTEGARDERSAEGHG